MLLKGRDLAFIGVDLEAPDGTKIAVAQSVVRGRKDQPKPALATAGDPPTATVTPPHQSSIRENAFMAGCGMDIVLQATRSEDRRVGKEWVSKGRTRWWP